MKTYNEIIKLSGYECANDHVIVIDEKDYLQENVDGLTEQGKDLFKDFDSATENKNKLHDDRKRNLISKLSPNCGVTKEMIPKILLL